MDLFIRYKFPLLFVGHTSTGKTTFVMDKLINGLDRDLFVPLTIQFSKHTQANQVQVCCVHRLVVVLLTQLLNNVAIIINMFILGYSAI